MAKTNRAKQMMVKFGERLRALRQVAGYEDAAGFARDLGLERMRYAHYELGQRMPPIDVLDDIQRITKTDLNWLLLGRRIRSND